MTVGLRFVSQMAISSYLRKRNEDSSPLPLHVVTKIHTSRNPFHVLDLSKLFMMVLMYHFQDRKRKPSHCADSFIAGRQISEVLS